MQSWPDNTEVAVSNIRRSTLVLRDFLKQADNENSEICGAERPPPKQYQRMCSWEGRLTQTEVDSGALTSSEICDPNVTQVPERERRWRRLFCLTGLRQGEIYSSLFQCKTHLIQDRKHGGLTSPGSCRKIKGDKMS